MPSVKDIQAIKVHGRTNRANTASIRPEIKAAAAKE